MLAPELNGLTEGQVSALGEQAVLMVVGGSRVLHLEAEGGRTGQWGIVCQAREGTQGDSMAVMAGALQSD